MDVLAGEVVLFNTPFAASGSFLLSQKRPPSFQFSSFEYLPT
jgi:hypothetical protein